MSVEEEVQGTVRLPVVLVLVGCCGAGSPSHASTLIAATWVWPALSTSSRPGNAVSRAPLPHLSGDGRLDAHVRG
ncbi:hypothetical protein [Streptomyces uncialis]|uniref:hypothetical protein n=1 Tax=Streptomyces uncialis TaxID=1048205 RepID=UPI00386C58D0|nr:hypothetical protein OG268_36615 [Streptomyces uncialis]